MLYAARLFFFKTCNNSKLLKNNPINSLDGSLASYDLRKSNTSKEKLF